MSRIWITGYRSYELEIFKDDDPKLKVISSVLNDTLKNQIESGANWLITGAQLGVEQWAVNTASELKSTYPEFKIAVMLPFTEFGNQWNESNQAKLSQILTKADFTDSVSHAPYQSPRQLRAYQHFMLTHTDQAILLYDPEHPGKSKYDYDLIQKWRENHPYPLDLIDFDDLQDAANEYAENQNNSFNLD
ncbi:Hypothetical protein ADU72_2091 [Pediococcus damnosus]|uniref:UPF0398 protein ADU70_0633 n=1 Tax=Pediococcus damnosus TaxID=51663 RepID=A0A0R2HS87_9LACO|nr:DUF1273 domain-containing protein [Pediococcus damnosus]AMV61502.1 Hypothetical protein ADU69_1855 [Pediococcus damnosus]AMV62133.1 Hypothetical protein ADU70_0633 [Pediococcus damnosus]AMV65864.1 Hypothetical protein ADU71_1978 [Pediococcus damnosus]AMV68012.1 Hypothetical protein ADU72_2091 [Pediococcus damnosus]AMV70204.1 Hypothetical protein ADU73_1816 [Pediococcus damnosus]